MAITRNTDTNRRFYTKYIRVTISDLWTIYKRVIKMCDLEFLSKIIPEMDSKIRVVTYQKQRKKTDKMNGVYISREK